MVVIYRSYWILVYRKLNFVNSRLTPNKDLASSHPRYDSFKLILIDHWLTTGQPMNHNRSACDSPSIHDESRFDYSDPSFEPTRIARWGVWKETCMTHWMCDSRLMIHRMQCCYWVIGCIETLPPTHIPTDHCITYCMYTVYNQVYRIM